MNPALHKGLLTLHLVGMVGAIGLLAATAVAIKPRSVAMLFNVFIALGLVAGLVLYSNLVSVAKASGYALSTSFHATVGVKFILLLVAGAAGAFSARAAVGQKQQLAAILRLVGILALVAAVGYGLALRGL